MDSQARMAREIEYISLGLASIVGLLASVPVLLVLAAVDYYGRLARRRSYYERERNRRIELRNHRRMRLGDYVGARDVVEGVDGRPCVYDRDEYGRRELLARERRRIRRHRTLNRQPTAAEVRAQWGRVRESHEAMLRFGSLLCDIEAYVDNSLVRDRNGEIRGRRPGLKGWLTEHCPDLAARYPTVMRYKNMAVRFRQAVGIPEPYPVTVAIDGDAAVLAALRGGEEPAGRRIACRECQNDISVLISITDDINMFGTLWEDRKDKWGPWRELPTWREMARALLANAAGAATPRSAGAAAEAQGGAEEGRGAERRRPGVFSAVALSRVLNARVEPLEARVVFVEDAPGCAGSRALA